ncbi:unnamed protein product [Haemonchus placei]|uniref:Cyclic nucleotide-binding domain-containing protein n=1 Tax=Haemonchus placei TaxID=6290 RepID=A0A0N4W849_HAEPC|nr:unnamed protein product [Haemonchus placei]
MYPVQVDAGSTVIREGDAGNIMYAVQELSPVHLTRYRPNCIDAVLTPLFVCWLDQFGLLLHKDIVRKELFRMLIGLEAVHDYFEVFSFGRAVEVVLQIVQGKTRILAYSEKYEASEK